MQDFDNRILHRTGYKNIYSVKLVLGSIKILSYCQILQVIVEVFNQEIIFLANWHKEAHETDIMLRRKYDNVVSK